MRQEGADRLSIRAISGGQRMSPIEVIDYIADHDSWRAAQAHK